MDEIRCKNTITEGKLKGKICDKLLMKGKFAKGSKISIRCKSCKGYTNKTY